MNILEDVKSFIKSASKPLIVIIGPTATGKTAASLKIAHTINGEIISVDSRQIYKEMDIATDILSPKEQDGIPHHMLAIVPPDQAISLAIFKEMALKKIDEIYNRGHIPMLVGGTGLYISAITEGYKVPRVAPNEKLRIKLKKDAKEKGVGFVHDILKSLDPETAQTIHPNNLRYVIRAIEINKAGLKKENLKGVESPFDVYKIGVMRPRDEIYERINSRVDQQEDKGLIEEVKKLVKKGYDESLPSMTSLGVKEIIPYIKGKMTLPDCLEILKQNTRRYAKRQMTWLKRYDNVNWLNTKDIEALLNEKNNT